MARISGAVVLDQRAAYEHRLGSDFIERALNQLTEEERRAFAELLPISWIEIDAWNKIVMAFAAEAGRDVLELDAEIVGFGIERTFRGVWKVLLRITTDDAILSRAPMIWSKTFDTGHLAMRMIEKGHAELEVRGFPGALDLNLQGIGISTKRVLELGGRKDVKLTYTRTPTGVIYQATWK